MDNTYLQELINQTQERGGGLLLNYNDKPAVVVLTIDKYNELLNGTVMKATQAPQEAAAVPLAGQEEGKKKVLVTGGAGYIGSHLARELLKAGYSVVVIDNLSTGKKENIPGDALFLEGDLKDINFLRDIFGQYKFEAVFHMAASLEVEESVKEPEKYFENNVVNTEKLLSAMAEAGVKKIIFSSTAAVYGQQDAMPITEKATPRPNNPYGFSKLLGEKAIKYYTMYLGFKAIVFRYFNACGCDYDGKISATHSSHLIPTVLEVAKGTKPCLKVNGNDYDTFDGTCVRDYVHVLDIAKAHIAALEKIGGGEDFRVINIGTSKGSSVKQIINAASEILNRIIPMEIGPKRAGDAPATVADNTKLKTELGYDLQHSDMETIIQTTWNQICQQEKAKVESV